MRLPSWKTNRDGMAGPRQFCIISGVFCLCLLPGRSVAGATQTDPPDLPSAVERTVDFDHDILPIFESTCFRCHGPEHPRSGFRLDIRESALQGGDLNTNNIVPGDSEHSLLIHYVARVVEEMEMPPPGKGDPLTADQVGLLRAWIDQGAIWSESSARASAASLFSVNPVLRWISVEGDEQKFREHTGMKEGWAGGVEQFEMSEREDGKSLSVSGRALPWDHDYQVHLTLEQKDVFFTRFGWEQYREYYDNSGGYYEPFNNLAAAEPFLTLDRDLHLDIGKAWVELGLTIPELPRVLLGYEYHYIEGEKSLLQWLPEPATPFQLFNRKIAPAAKTIDSDTHVVHLDLSHEILGVLLEDSVRFEDYELKTRRGTVRPFVNPQRAKLPVGVREDYEHQRVMNTFRAEKQVTDWLLLSAGHLYHRLEGGGGLQLNFLDQPGQPAVAGDSIVIKEWSHVGNLNAQAGPWNRFTLATGAQSEWSHQEGFGNALVGFDTIPQFGAFQGTNLLPATIRSDLDRFHLEEHAALRFNGVPRTVWFGEARLKQDEIGQYEEQLNGTAFLRDTDASSHGEDLRAGFQTSPWRRVSLSAHYRRKLSDNQYDHLQDSSSVAPSGNGYSAFITENDLDTEEVEARLVLRPANWLKTSLACQTVSTDFETTTASASTTPGGTLHAGTYDANVYSAGLVLSPIRRLSLSGTFSYSDSRIETFNNGSASIVPFRGDVYNLLFGGTYVINPKTDLTTQYYFSHADYGQNNQAAGLPVGIVYDRHGLVAGLRRQWTDHFSTLIQYGWFRYEEPSSGGFNDYRAHAVFATAALRWP